MPQDTKIDMLQDIVGKSHSVFIFAYLSDSLVEGGIASNLLDIFLVTFTQMLRNNSLGWDPLF